MMNRWILAAAMVMGLAGVTAGEEWFDKNYGAVVKDAEKGSADDREALYVVLMSAAKRVDAPALGKREALVQAMKVAHDGKMGEAKLKAAAEAALDVADGETIAAARGRIEVLELAQGAGVKAEERFSDAELAGQVLTLAERLYATGELKEALAATERAAALEKKAAGITGMHELSAGELRGQIAEEMAVDEALKQNPADAKASQKKGILLLSHGREGEAAGYLEKSPSKELTRLGAALKGKSPRSSAEEHLALARAMNDGMGAVDDGGKMVLGLRGLAEAKAALALKPTGAARAGAEFLQVKLEKVVADLAMKPRPRGEGKVSFLGSDGDGVTRVVYVLDHSGSMLDSFSLLRAKVLQSVGRLDPGQRFRVVMFSETVDRVYPKVSDWAAVTAETKKGVEDLLDPRKVAGENDDLLTPFLGAIKSALATKPPPDVVYFLTDGNFDPKLVDEVAKVNAGKKVKINTIAFVKISREAEENLKKIARDNGGKYKFVSEKDLGAQ